jgi:adenine/guanine/hypoxanthine permease
VAQGAGTPVTLGNLATPAFLTFVVGLGLAIALLARGVKAAILISIIAATVVGVVLRSLFGDAAGFGPGQAVVPEELLFNFQADNFSTLLAPLGYMLSVWTRPETTVITVGLVVFALMLSDFFDTMGTVIGVGEQAGLVDKRGRLPGIKRVLAVDSVGAVLGGLFSTSSNTTYIESAAGVSEGGRTGLTSIVVGVLFLAAILIAPIAGMVPQQATAAALVVVGYLMFRTIGEIEWGEIDEVLPALATMIVMPLTYSITDGIAAGFITYVFIKLVRGRISQVHPLLTVVSILFVIYLAIPWLQQTFSL